jgi:hypothetical protein
MNEQEHVVNMTNLRAHFSKLHQQEDDYYKNKAGKLWSTPEYTHAFFANSEFRMLLAEIAFKEQLSTKNYVSYSGFQLY